MRAPCVNCENKGCGSYHDKCEKYQEYKAERQKINKENSIRNASSKEWLNNRTYKARNDSFKIAKRHKNKSIGFINEIE